MPGKTDPKRPRPRREDEWNVERDGLAVETRRHRCRGVYLERRRDPRSVALEALGMPGGRRCDQR
ncbi:MAG: hypothetical protein ACXW2C_10090, partial [Acidimicrobiia bacterium]